MASPTFAGASLTNTADHGGAKDSNWPSFGNLEPKQIALPTALKGLPTCTLGTKVYGDMQSIVYKSREMAVVLNDTLSVGVNRTETIEAANHIMVKGGRLVEITPTETLQVQGNREVWVHGADSEHYLIHREISEPVERIEFSEKSIEYGSAKAEAFALVAETKAVSIVVENIKASIEMFATQNKAIVAKLEPLQAMAEAMSVKVGALMLSAKTRLNAMVNWATSSPTS